MDNRTRLDVALVGRGLAPSRQRAANMIRAGQVQVDGRVVRRPAFLCGPEAVIEAADPLKYVGRGGLKLEAALERFAIDPLGLVCLDVGASTGGFTDCLLQRGACHVYAVDVGHGQLAQALMQDSRVTGLEGTDVRGLEAERLGGPVDLAVCDVSFISLTLVLPAIYDLVRDGGALVALIKPQFEVGPGHVGKGGLVRDGKAHETAIRRVLETAKVISFTVVDLIESPVRGGDGNVEYLAHLLRGAGPVGVVDIPGTVEAALGAKREARDRRQT